MARPMTNRMKKEQQNRIDNKAVLDVDGWMLSLPRMEWQPEEFYPEVRPGTWEAMRKQEERTQERRQKRMREDEEKGQRKKLYTSELSHGQGYTHPTPRAAQELGCLEVDNLDPIDLDCEIHPLLARERWRTTDELFERITPALRLASMLLESRHILPFFYTMLFMPLNWNEELQKAYFYDKTDQARMDIEIEHLAKEEIENTRKALYTLGESGTVEIYLNEEAKAHAHGRTQVTELPMLDENGEEDKYAAINRTEAATHGYSKKPQAVMVIDANSWHYIANHFQTSTPSRKMRFYYNFAITLAHETVHAVYDSMNRDWNCPAFKPNDGEPYWYLDDGSNELGWALENFIANRSEYKLNTSDSKFSLYATEFQCEKVCRLNAGREPDADRPARQFSPVPMAWINQWFRKDFWQRYDQEGRDMVPGSPSSGLGFVNILHIRDVDPGWRIVGTEFISDRDLVHFSRRWKKESSPSRAKRLLHQTQTLLLPRPKPVKFTHEMADQMAQNIHEDLMDTSEDYSRIVSSFAPPPPSAIPLPATPPGNTTPTKTPTKPQKTPTKLQKTPTKLQKTPTKVQKTPLPPRTPRGKTIPAKTPPKGHKRKISLQLFSPHKTTKTDSEEEMEQ